MSEPHSNATPATATAVQLRPLWLALTVMLWAVPLGLLVCVPGMVMEWFHLLLIVMVQGELPRLLWMIDLLPTVAVWALFAVAYQHLERYELGKARLERTLFYGQMLVIFCAGTAPFVMWNFWVTHEPVFRYGSLFFAVSAFLFIMHLNTLLRLLADDLPDPVLQADTRLFSKINTALMAVVLNIVSAYVLCVALESRDPVFRRVMENIATQGHWLLVLLVLPAVSSTGIMVWKTRQTVLRLIFPEPETAPASDTPPPVAPPA